MNTNCKGVAVLTKSCFFLKPSFAQTRSDYHQMKTVSSSQVILFHYHLYFPSPSIVVERLICRSPKKKTLIQIKSTF